MDSLPFYTVYENPSDFPGKFVVRRMDFRMGPHGVSEAVFDKDPMAVSDTIDEARAVIPEHCFNIGRMNMDDPVIKEVWL
jgi:hypothetical protein